MTVNDVALGDKGIYLCTARVYQHNSKYRIEVHTDSSCVTKQRVPSKSESNTTDYVCQNGITPLMSKKTMGSGRGMQEVYTVLVNNTYQYQKGKVAYFSTCSLGIVPAGPLFLFLSRFENYLALRLLTVC